MPIVPLHQFVQPASKEWLQSFHKEKIIQPIPEPLTNDSTNEEIQPIFSKREVATFSGEIFCCC